MSSSSVFNAPTSRRRFLSIGSALLGSAALAGCTTFSRVPVYSGVPPMEPGGYEPGAYEQDSNYALMYGPVVDNGFTVPAVPWQKIDPQFLRQQVPDPFGELPGTIIVDTRNHFLYLTQQGGRAMRYGVGLGRQGFEWSGDGVIQWKQVWPKWTPPREMIARQPELAKYDQDLGGMPGGLMNPLGARALYIFQNGQDTLYRLHGNPEWTSIGRNVSSGCVRLMNQDIIDLYDRVPNGSKLKVI